MRRRSFPPRNAESIEFANGSGSVVWVWEVSSACGKGERAQMHACELDVATAPLTDSKSPRMRIFDDARFLTKAVLKRLNALAVKKPSKADFKVFSLR